MLATRHPLSPLTREPLEQTLFANRNLKKRIEQHEKEMLNAAEQAVAVHVAEVHSKRGAEAGSSSSSEPPAKRTRGFRLGPSMYQHGPTGAHVVHMLGAFF